MKLASTSATNLFVGGEGKRYRLRGKEASCRFFCFKSGGCWTSDFDCDYDLPRGRIKYCTRQSQGSQTHGVCAIKCVWLPIIPCYKATAMESSNTYSASESFSISWCHCEEKVCSMQRMPCLWSNSSNENTSCHRSVNISDLQAPSLWVDFPELGQKRIEHTQWRGQQVPQSFIPTATFPSKYVTWVYFLRIHDSVILNAQHFGSFTTFNSFCKPHQCIIRELDNSSKERFTKYCRLFLKHQEFSKNQKNGRALRCMIYLSFLSLATLYLLSLGTPDVESSSYGWRSPTVKPQHFFSVDWIDSHPHWSYRWR